MPFLKNTLIHAAFTCALIVTSLAQTREAGIFVAVKDQFGDTISDAEIVLGKSDEEEKQIKTNHLGIGQFLNLSAGEYRITISAAGFEEYKSQNIIVKNNETRRIEIVLEIASIESKVEIGEDDNVADAERNGVTTTLNEREIANLPDNQEELERAIKRIGESVAGEELPISVNGVQGGKIPPKGSIQQIRVNQNVFSAQYDSPFGGGIEIFTRSNV
ncbi:MAG: carboxypeptidase-like regulatory domain-containing protein, partial [Acidobacteriota bacterium]|nr:carboxypeptidase-like regulatory domain-containing protein [Acidobacteriota bacterium]